MRVEKKEKGNGLPRLSLGYSSVFFLFILYSLLPVIGNRELLLAPFAIACLAADFSFALSISLSLVALVLFMDGWTEQRTNMPRLFFFRLKRESAHFGEGAPRSCVIRFRLTRSFFRLFIHADGEFSLSGD